MSGLLLGPQKPQQQHRMHACRRHNDLVAKSNSEPHHHLHRSSSKGENRAMMASFCVNFSAFLLTSHHMNVRQRTTAAAFSRSEASREEEEEEAATTTVPLEHMEWGDKNLRLHHSYFQFPFCSNKTGSVPDHLPPSHGLAFSLRLPVKQQQ